MTIYQLHDRVPQIEDDCYIAEEAVVIGKVRIAAGASIWPGAVLRGDIELIDIGPRTSIQDGAVLHTDPGCPLTIGAGVTVGHQAMLHGCEIGDGTLVGIHAIVLNRSVVGPGCLIGAGALLTGDKKFPEGSLILGSPARVARDLTPEERERIQATAERYVNRAVDYRSHLKKI